MPYSDRNLCQTMENRARYETQRCSVVRRQQPPYQHMTTDYHEWPDHRGGVTGGTCIHCGKTLEEVRVLVKPEPRRVSRIAAEIARTVRDVPPVRFIETRARVEPT